MCIRDSHIEGGRAVAERLVAVREAFRHVHRKSVLFRKLDTEPAQMRRRSFAHIDDDVVDCSFGATHELDLGVRIALKMHTAHRASAGVCTDIGLHEHAFEPIGGEILHAKGARERAALIRARIKMDKVSAGKRYRLKSHVIESGTRRRTASAQAPRTRKYRQGIIAEHPRLAPGRGTTPSSG